MSLLLLLNISEEDEKLTKMRSGRRLGLPLQEMKQSAIESTYQALFNGHEELSQKVLLSCL